jgi:hypothetical protein
VSPILFLGVHAGLPLGIAGGNAERRARSAVDGRLRGHDVEWGTLAQISSWPRMDEIAKIVRPEAVNIALSTFARRNPLT